MASDQNTFPISVLVEQTCFPTGAANGESFRSAVCQCLKTSDEATANITANGLNNLLNFDFNTTSVVKPSTEQPPVQCANATFVPARNLFVCDAEGVQRAGACRCPKDIPFFGWNRSVPAECFEFVTAATEGGKCLAPAAPALAASSGTY
jgi:hypothetical protein